jgi:undecaprenyl-diphosphatase
LAGGQAWLVTVCFVQTGQVSELDATVVEWINAAVRNSPLWRALVGAAARWLAGVEVLLMVALAVAGRRQLAARMLASVGLIYLASEALGAIWPRERPFSERKNVEALARHARGRSFPSRHVASGLAMAAIGRRGHPLLGGAMAAVAVLLGVCRVGAGLHYPSDVVAGAILGVATHILGNIATYIVCSYSGKRTRP